MMLGDTCGLSQSCSVRKLDLSETPGAMSTIHKLCWYYWTPCLIRSLKRLPAQKNSTFSASPVPHQLACSAYQKPVRETRITFLTEILTNWVTPESPRKSEGGQRKQNNTPDSMVNLIDSISQPWSDHRASNHLPTY